MPDPGTVYHLRGKPALYVRTEKRPGCPEPEHLFVKVEECMVFQVWTRVVPSDAELIIDTEGRKEANETRWLLEVAEHNIGILVGLLKQACDWLPRERAQELRKRYVDAQPPKEEM